MVVVDDATGVTVSSAAPLKLVTYSNGPLTVFWCPGREALPLVWAEPQTTFCEPGKVIDCCAHSLNVPAARSGAGTASSGIATIPTKPATCRNRRAEFE